MNLLDAMLAEFDQEAPATRRLLEAVPEAKYGWRAHEKAMSLGELCAHIGGVLNGMPRMLDGDSFDVSQRPPAQPAPTDQAGILARFDEGVSRSRSWLRGLGDRTDDSWRFHNGEMEIMTAPRIVAIRTLLFNHIYHHRGQLSGYLRAAGEAVPSIYGPTADVNPFAA
jgi:uncharacterized damage-inducible protein DinB